MAVDFISGRKKKSGTCSAVKVIFQEFSPLLFENLDGAKSLSLIDHLRLKVESVKIFSDYVL